MNMNDDKIRRVVETALPIARQRAELAAEIRAALEAGDDSAALVLMRRYLGLPTVQLKQAS